MAGILLDKNQKTLRTDALAELGVSVKDMNLTCTRCGEDFMLPAPWENGEFDPDWFACPNLRCREAADRKTA